MWKKRKYKVTYAYTDGSAVYVRTEKVVKRKGGMCFPRCVDDITEQMKEDNPDKKGLVILGCIDLKTKAIYKLVNSAPLEEKKMWGRRKYKVTDGLAAPPSFLLKEKISKGEQVWFQVEDSLPNGHAEEVHVKDNTCLEEGDYLEVMSMRENKLDPSSITQDSVRRIRTAVLMNRSATQRETKALEALKSMSEEEWKRMTHQEPLTKEVFASKISRELAKEYSKKFSPFLAKETAESIEDEIEKEKYQEPSDAGVCPVPRVSPDIRSKMDTQVLLRAAGILSPESLTKALEKEISQMPSKENQPEAKQTWLEQLQDIRRMLNEGHTLMAQVIGPYLKDAQSMPDPENYSDRMGQELEQVALSVRNLVDAIANIHDKF